MNPEEIAAAGSDTAGVLYVASLLTLAAILTWGWMFRKRVGDRGKVWLICTSTILIPLTFLLATYSRHGEEFIDKGTRAPALARQVQNLERYLTSEEHDVQSEELYSLVILGDSTHYYGMKAAEELMPQIEMALPKALRDEMELFGLRYMGLDAFDYYFLLNWLVEDKPDMILLPINLRSFGEMWAESERNRFPSLERFIRWGEISRASHIASGSRSTRWDLVSMRKLDYTITHGRGSSFLRGAKLIYGERKQKLEEGFEERYSEYGEYIPSSFLDESERFYERMKRSYAQYVDPENSMLGAFSALNDLARRHGIRVVYYTVESDRKHVRQEENFELIERSLTKDPDVHFVNTLGLLDYRHFLQYEHLTSEGLELLAHYLANEVGKIVQQELGLTDITFVPLEKGIYSTQTALQTLADGVEGMSLSELEAFVKTLDLEQAEDARQLWERKHGSLP